MLTHAKPTRRTLRELAHTPVWAMVAVLAVLVSACSSSAVEASPPTIETARPAVSPPAATPAAGRVVALPAGALAAAVDSDSAALVVLTGAEELRVVDPGGSERTVALPATATALTAPGDGVVYLAVRGGYLRVALVDGAVGEVTLAGQEDTDFTAITRRADGRLALGSATGAVYTLDADGQSVAARLPIFARVDQLAAVGDTVVVLDRGQTSVTAVDADGVAAQQALRAGEGATTMAVDSDGRALVADTRGGELLVFGVDPLMMRQRYPVAAAPYGVTGGAGLAWVSQTASNTVVGYDLSTGIPVEKVRYPTVRQPDVLAYDDGSDTLYVVSAVGDGVQVIAGAGR